MKVKTNYKGGTVFNSLKDVLLFELKYMIILDKWIMEKGKWVPLEENVDEEAEKKFQRFERAVENYCQKRTYGSFIDKLKYKYFVRIPKLKDF